MVPETEPSQVKKVKHKQTSNKTKTTELYCLPDGCLHGRQFNIMNKMHEDRKQNIAETREDKSKTEKKTAVNGSTPRDRRSPQKDLLIGSSLIKDIEEDKLINTKMICIRGASLRNISDELNDLNSTFKNITIIAGRNDCS